MANPVAAGAVSNPESPERFPAAGGRDPTPADPLVVVERVSFRYGGMPAADRSFALKDVDLRLHRGEFVAVIGENGSGKTTLARHLNGLLKPTAGRVLVAGEDTRTVGVSRLAARVGYAFQNPDHQLFAPTVGQDVAFGPGNLGLNSDEVAQRVSTALTALGLDHVADRHPLLLAHGQRRLVALAGVLALRPDLLVLDEPTVGLDPPAARRVLATLHAHRGQGTTIFMITHDLALAAAHATRVVVLGGGEVVANGPTRAVLTDVELLHESGLTAPVLTRLAKALAALGVPADPLTIDELCDGYAAVWQGRRAPESEPEAEP